MTGGRPRAISSEVPAKNVYDFMFRAQNLGQGFAASTMMLVTVAIIVVPWAYLEFGGQKAWLNLIPSPVRAVPGRATSLSRAQYHALRDAVAVVAVYYLAAALM